MNWEAWYVALPLGILAVPAAVAISIGLAVLAERVEEAHRRHRRLNRAFRVVSEPSGDER